MDEAVVDPSPLGARMTVEAIAATISAFCVGEFACIACISLPCATRKQRQRTAAGNPFPSVFSAAPAISIVDKAIVSNASGLEPLVPSLINGVKTLVSKPIYFLRQPSFLLILGVYSGTYIVANNIEAICERQNRSSFYPKFVGSSIANVTLSVLKDKAFARMFGKGDPRPMHFSSLALFGARDSMTILASFSLPGIISKQLQQDCGVAKLTADTSAQLVTPCAMQFLSTPLHLLGLDIYNRPTVSGGDRIRFVQQEYVKTALARIARIFPAYGIGGVVNKYMRKTGNGMLFEHYSAK